MRKIAQRAHGEHGDLCDVCFKGPVATCRICERSMVIDAVMTVAATATHEVVAEVVADVTEGSAALRSIRQALTSGPGALLVGAPP